MQPDLMGLEISKGELRRLTGFDPDDVFRPSMIKNSEKRLGLLVNELLVALALTPIVVGFIYTLIILPTIGSSITLGVLLLILVPTVIFVGRSLWQYLTCPHGLTVLLDEVDKYHTVVQAIDINDQLATLGNSQSSLNDRDNVIAALKLIREDLVVALKSERILRDNKKLLANNQDLFINNLAHLQALQLSSQTSEYAQLLNQSLQIALDVQAEMKKLQKI
ncbi:hypothetical protein [Nostoc sp. CCY0012]|uniref:hypothetical protein n=1 Tax=Nostoc sp. CCY0012 TaxID=1056123 RepID=UPI0039C6C2E5